MYFDKQRASGSDNAMTAFLSQGIDYFGFFDAKLRDLQGYATLAHELIQTAGDAQAESMSFDVRDEALVVENTNTSQWCCGLGRPGKGRLSVRRCGVGWSTGEQAYGVNQGEAGVDGGDHRALWKFDPRMRLSRPCKPAGIMLY